MDQAYERDILLRIHRHYEKDEVVGLAVSIIKSQDIEIGMLRSEVSELKDVISRRNKKISDIKFNLKSATKEMELLYAQIEDLNNQIKLGRMYIDYIESNDPTSQSA